MPTEPLNPSVESTFRIRYAENTAGIIAAINACIVTAGGTMTSYPSNTSGVIRALLDLKTAIGGSGGSGESVELSLTSGEALGLGEAVYLHTDGKAYKATNDGTRAEATVLGLVKAAVGSGAATDIVLYGKFSGLSGLTAASEYFVGTGGAITTTAPSTATEYVCDVGQAISAAVFNVDPQSPVLLS